MHVKFIMDKYLGENLIGKVPLLKNSLYLFVVDSLSENTERRRVLAIRETHFLLRITTNINMNSVENHQETEVKGPKKK